MGAFTISSVLGKQLQYCVISVVNICKFLLISILLTGDLQVSLTQIGQKPKSREAAPLAEG